MEANNKCREALKLAKSFIDGYGDINDLELRRKVDAALAEPIRNCDVGTAGEQATRFAHFCFFRKCFECQLKNVAKFPECGFLWSQMPYEEGETK